MKKMTKFSSLSKNDKIFRVINLTLMCLSELVIIGGIVYYAVAGDPNNRIWAGAALLVFNFAPYFVELILRTRLPNFVFLFVVIYIAIAGIWGSLFAGYYTVECLDIVVHTIMGYFACLIGMLILSKVSEYKNLSALHIVLFCFAFSMMTELVWELCEWFSDVAIGQTAQGLKIDGYGVPLVTDTMEDILCNAVGGIVFAIHYALSRHCKVTLGMRSLERDLSGYDRWAEPAKEASLSEEKNAQGEIIYQNSPQNDEKTAKNHKKSEKS